MSKSDLTLDQTLHRLATSSPNNACVRALDGSTELSYAVLDHAASAFAAYLRDEGIQAGDRVVIGFGNVPSFFVVLFGCFRAQVAAVPLDASLSARELEGVFELVAPAALVVDAASLHRFDSVASRCTVITPTDELLRGWCTKPVHQLADRSSAARDPQEPALILYTSGTTGSPKGVVSSQRGLAGKTQAIARWFDLDASFRTLCVLPTYFGHGLIANCLTTLSVGGTLVIGPAFNLDILRDLWKLVRDHRITNFSSVPTLIRLLNQSASHEHGRVTPDLKFVTCASAPLQVREVEAFQERFGVPLLNCYGLTETSSWSVCSPNREDRDITSVGYPVGCEVRVVDRERRARAPGERGEIEIKGPGVMTGYFRAPALTAGVMHDGWFATGDEGEIDAAGRVYLHARIKDMIIRAGKNVYPAEVDAVLLSHPGVLEACSVGVPDALLGEKIMACVVPRSGGDLSEAALLAHARLNLAAYKCPERVLFVSSIPKTTRGKVRSADVRALFEGASV